MRALYPDREQGGVLECEAAEHESGLDHVGLWVGGLRQALQRCPEKIVGVRAKCNDQAVSGSKQAVDGARRGGRFGGDAAYREGVDSSFVDCPLARGEERRRRELIVLSWSSHA